MVRLFRILTALGLVGLGTWLGWNTLKLYSFAQRPADTGSQKEIVIEVKKGSSRNQIALYLLQHEVIRDANQFILLGRILKKWSALKAGEYAVSPRMTPLEILSVLTSGVSIAHPLTIHEGDNIYQVAMGLTALKLFDGDLEIKSEFLRLARDRAFLSELGFDRKVPSVEGYLFPETYFFNKSQTLREMVKIMVAKFRSVWNPEFQARAAQLGFSQHEVVTLASIIEKETGAPEERPMISSVFHNRLKKQMRLQSDPTTIYGIWNTYQGNLRKEHLLLENPYNTYTLPRLPIGPIGNPGLESIRAALYPRESHYLYFVSKNAGTHVFSETFEQHNSAVRKFQVDSKAREGKSWRDRLRSGGSSQLGSMKKSHPKRNEASGQSPRDHVRHKVPTR